MKKSVRVIDCPELRALTPMGEADTLRTLLKELFYASPGYLTCNDMHHNKSDRHKIGEVCPPLNRYNAAMHKVAEYFGIE